jgi:glycosyltransferase involved in cell wall biosynthesis
MKSPWPARVLVLAPQVWSADGGVQRYSRSLVEAFAIVRPMAGMELQTLLDRPQGPWCRSRLVGAALRAALLPWRRPDLVVATHLHLAPLAWLVARLSRARLWVVVHGIESWALMPGLRRWSLRQADLLLPVSSFTAEQLQRQLPTLPTMEVLPNTYDANRFHPGARPPALLERYGLDPNQLLVFSLTRLSRGDRAKHLDRLISAMVDLRRSIPEAVLLIGGEGEDRPRLQALVRELGLEKVVLLPGRISDDELPDHYRLASAFALPSEKEGFGIVFLEALGSGCPVLAGNRDGSRDPLANGRFGLLVDPDQPLAPALESLLRQQGNPLWFNPVDLARAVAAEFAFPAYCQKLEILIQGRSIIQGRSHHSGNLNVL